MLLTNVTLNVNIKLCDFVCAKHCCGEVELVLGSDHTTQSRHWLVLGMGAFVCMHPGALHTLRALVVQCHPLWLCVQVSLLPLCLP